MKYLVDFSPCSTHCSFALVMIPSSSLFSSSFKRFSALNNSRYNCSVSDLLLLLFKLSLIIEISPSNLIFSLVSFFFLSAPYLLEKSLILNFITSHIPLYESKFAFLVSAITSLIPSTNKSSSKRLLLNFQYPRPRSICSPFIVSDT